MSTKDRATYRMRQASVLDTFNPHTYRAPGILLDHAEAGAGIFGTLTLAQYMERRGQPEPTFTNPRSQQQDGDE
jgi:hypothetical protein